MSLETMTPTVTAAEPSRLRRAAERAIRRGDLQSAKRFLRQCVVLDRRDGRAWALYGRAHYQRGNYPLAIVAFERARRNGELDEESQLLLGLSHSRLGQVVPARRLLAKLLQQETLSASRILQIALGLHAIGSTHLAIRACRRAVRSEPGHAQAYFDLGYYCGLAGYPRSTVECLMQRAVKVEPNNPRYQVGLACLLAKAGRQHEAWTVVRNLGLTSISVMTCACCLERLLELYDRANDERRRTVCRQRLVELRLRGCGFEC